MYTKFVVMLYFTYLGPLIYHHWNER